VDYTFNEYSRRAATTLKKGQSARDRLTEGAIGLASETGEVTGLIKAWMFHGKKLDVEELELELGDAMWYINEICLATGLTLEGVAKGNNRKLAKRHPHGFLAEEGR